MLRTDSFMPYIYIYIYKKTTIQDKKKDQDKPNETCLSSKLSIHLGKPWYVASDKNQRRQRKPHPEDPKSRLSLNHLSPELHHSFHGRLVHLLHRPSQSLLHPFLFLFHSTEMIAAQKGLPRLRILAALPVFSIPLKNLVPIDEIKSFSFFLHGRRVKTPD